MADLNRLVLKGLPLPKAIEIDTEAHSVYIRFSNAKVKTTVADERPGSITAIDFDAGQQIVGVEIVGLSGLTMRAIRQALA